MAATMEEVYKAHVVVLTFNGQGHTNPMLQFSKQLASKGLKITLAATTSAIKSMEPHLQHSFSSSITFNPIYDDLTLGGFGGEGGFKGFVDRFESFGSENMRDLVKKHLNGKYPVKCLVYDISLPWGLELARELGLLVGAFVTQACAAMHTYVGMIREYLSEEKEGKEKGPLPELGIPFLPNMGTGPGGLPVILLFILNQYTDLGKADWVLFNSYHKLEEEVVKDLLKQYPVKTIGPCLSLEHLNKPIEAAEDNGAPSKSTGDICIDWLNTKEKGSVVYIAFGSAVILTPEQMEELAWGLKDADTNFLWVVREPDMSKIPVNFKEATAEKGLVVAWCQQLEVLSNPAVGCFLTHCGWNSTVEAVSLGVPMIAFPQYLDQFTDAKFIDQVWQSGVRVTVDEKNFVVRAEIEKCIKEVMQGDKAENIRRNAAKWKEMAKEALLEGGSSDRNIEEIVAKVSSH